MINIEFSKSFTEEKLNGAKTEFTFNSINKGDLIQITLTGVRDWNNPYNEYICYKCGKNGYQYGGEDLKGFFPLGMLPKKYAFKILEDNNKGSGTILYAYVSNKIFISDYKKYLELSFDGIFKQDDFFCDDRIAFDGSVCINPKSISAKALLDPNCAYKNKDIKPSSLRFMQSIALQMAKAQIDLKYLSSIKLSSNLICYSTITKSKGDRISCSNRMFPDGKSYLFEDSSYSLLFKNSCSRLKILDGINSTVTCRVILDKDNKKHFFADSFVECILEDKINRSLFEDGKCYNFTVIKIDYSQSLVFCDFIQDQQRSLKKEEIYNFSVIASMKQLEDAHKQFSSIYSEHRLKLQNLKSVHDKGINRIDKDIFLPLSDKNMLKKIMAAKYISALGNSEANASIESLNDLFNALEVE